MKQADRSNRGNLDCLERLEQWYASMCNGDWEHTYGIVLETVDNPGWMLTVDLTDTPLMQQPFAVYADRVSDTDWIHCSVEGAIFRGSAGMSRLSQMLGVFLDWAEQSDEDSVDRRRE